MPKKMPSWLQELWGELLTPPKFMNTPKTTASAKTDTAAKPTSSNHSQQQPKGPAPVKPKSVPTPSKPKSDSLRDNPLVKTPIESSMLEKENTLVSIKENTPASKSSSWLDVYPFTVKEQETADRLTKLRTDKGLYALKRTAMPPQRIEFLVDALTYSHSRGFRQYAPIIETATGEPYVYDTEHHVHYVTKWIKGRSIDFQSLSDIGQSARSLARFHETTRGLPSGKYRPPTAFDVYGSLKERSQQLAGFLSTAEVRGSRDDTDALFVRHAPGFDRQASLALSMLRSNRCKEQLRKEEQHPGLCHLDVTAHHLLRTNDQSVTLVHLDSATFAPRVLDLAHLIRRGMQAQNWRSEVALVALVQYNTVRGLSEGEYTLLEALLTFPQRLWHLGHMRYQQGKKGNRELFEQLFDQEEARQSFLKSFSRQVTRSRDQ